MYDLYWVYLIQAVSYTLICNFTEKHVYHVGVIYYPLPIMCTFISSLLLFYHDCITCMLFIVGQKLF